MKKVRGMLFDLDGTLFYTLKDLAVCMNLGLREAGLYDLPVDSYREIVGGGIREMGQKAIATELLYHRERILAVTEADPSAWSGIFTPEVLAGALPPADHPLITAILKDFHEAYDADPIAHTYPYEGITDLLDYCVANGFKIGVVSNKDEYFTVPIVRELLPQYNWDVILGVRPGLPPKPDPAMALSAAAGWHLQPEQIALLGDTGTAMTCARAAGQRAWAAGWGYRPESELRSAGAEMFFVKPTDILTYLKREEETE